MFHIPAVLSARLDELVRLLEVEVVGPRGSVEQQRYTTRKELVAALLFAADPRPEVLRELVETYREAVAGAAAVPPRKRGGITVPANPPGIRPTKEQERARSRGERPTRRNRRTAAP